MMRGLIKGLNVRPNRKEGKAWNGKTYELISDLVYASRSGLIITVPKGFITDFATWFKPTGQYIEAAVVHDYLYDVRAGKRYADKMFKEMMERAGCSRARINFMYYGVRLFGWWGYHVLPFLKRITQKSN